RDKLVTGVQTCALPILTDAESSTGPTNVLNMRLNRRGSASFFSPQLGQATLDRSSAFARQAEVSASPSASSSRRKRFRQLRHSRSEERRVGKEGGRRGG